MANGYPARLLDEHTVTQILPMHYMIVKIFRQLDASVQCNVRFLDLPDDAEYRAATGEPSTDLHTGRRR